jgi:hypothetical protein
MMYSYSLTSNARLSAKPTSPNLLVPQAEGHGIRNPEANIRYAFQSQQRTTGNPSDIFSSNMTILK